MNSKGYTLVEIIIALSIAAILAVCMVGLVVPIYRSYQRTTRSAEAQMIGENVLDKIKDTVSTASEFNITEAEGISILSTDEHELSTSNDGYLIIDGYLAFDKDYYNDMNITVEFTKAGFFRAEVLIIVYYGIDELYSVNGTASSVRALLSDTSKSTPDGMLEVARRSSDSHAGSSDSLFRDIYEDVYDSKLPSIDISSVIPLTKLTALYNAAYSEDAGSTTTNRYSALLDDSFVIAPYITSSTYIPFVYATNAASSLSSQSSAPIYLMYYGEAWYISTSKTSAAQSPSTFDGYSDAQVQSMLSDSSIWTAVASL